MTAPFCKIKFLVEQQLLYNGTLCGIGINAMVVTWALSMGYKLGFASPRATPLPRTITTRGGHSRGAFVELSEGCAGWTGRVGVRRRNDRVMCIPVRIIAVQPARVLALRAGSGLA